MPSSTIASRRARCSNEMLFAGDMNLGSHFNPLMTRVRPRVALLTATVALLCAMVGDAVYAEVDPVSTAEMRRKLEAATKEYTYFATDDIIANRHSENRWPAEVIAEQAKLAAELAKWSQQPQALRELIDHQDAKVRTLVLGALFVSEDPQELPLIASLADDKAPTFPHVHFSFRSDFRVPLHEMVDPQTVGQVAQRMLAAYQRASFIKNDDGFAGYWRIYQGRQTCASWFLVKLNRATRQSSPPQPQYQHDVRRVISEVEKLPPVERAWTLVFLRSMNEQALDPALIDPACLASLQEIGPERIMQFLRRERVGDDPDLHFDNFDRQGYYAYGRMMQFVLRHAIELLRREDAAELLSQEESLRQARTGLGNFPEWAAAAAELTAGDPAAASQIIEAALHRFSAFADFGGYQAVLIASLWRIRGADAKQKIVDWFYEPQAVHANDNSSVIGVARFLRSVKAARRPDTRELIAALVADRRFDQTGRPALRELLDIASEGQATPLVSAEEIHGPEGRTDEALARWREILRRHYAISF